jgi:RluA family pseudouridine synthase
MGLGGRIARCRIRPEWAGKSLLDVLAERFTYHNRETWAARLADGRVECNGHPATGEERVADGDVVEYHCADIPEPPVPTDFHIVHEDEDLLVIAKPAGLPVHPAGRYFAHTLWALLQDSGYDGLHFASRLDRETSGLLLAARNPGALAQYQRLNQDGRLAKTYLVAVEGEPPEQFSAKGWLSRDPHSVIRKKRRFTEQRLNTAGEQDAETHFHRLELHAGMALLEARLVTGRTHQIRATLCSLGFPIVGDKLYGLDETRFLRFRDDELTTEDHQALRLPYQALHSWKLAILTDGDEARAWSCPPPPSFARLFPRTFANATENGRGITDSPAVE